MEFLDSIPAIREKLMQLAWGKSGTDSPTENNEHFLQQIYLDEDEKITLVCLASLKVVATMQHSFIDFSKKTERIIWFNEGKDIVSGFNYKLSPEDFSFLMNEQVPIAVISDFNKNSLLMDDAYWNQVAGIPSRYAQHLSGIHLSIYVKDNLDYGREHMWDDYAALYLLEPDKFTIQSKAEYVSLDFIVPMNPDSLVYTYLNALKEKTPDYKVFSQIPSDEHYFAEDITPHIQDIISRHGLPEWRAGILTNELHGHLGIYSLIGMKMGIRVREYFNIGLDDLKIHSLAGLSPPISCMNDGLQVSTGSTLGHGLIQSSECSDPQPAAIFIFKNRKIKVSLKKQYVDIIRTDVHEAIMEYGLGTQAYWKCIRELAIKYWLELDRNNIFTINKI